MLNFIIKEDDKDDFIIENFLFESSLLSYDEKKK